MSTKANIVIDAGTTFSTTFNLTDDNGDALNLNGAVANSQMRKWYGSTNAITFTTFVDTAEGSISLSLTSEQTSVIDPGRYLYDVEVTYSSTNTVSRVVEGLVTVTPNITR